MSVRHWWHAPCYGQLEQEQLETATESNSLAQSCFSMIFFPCSPHYQTQKIKKNKSYYYVPQLETNKKTDQNRA
jgi:hypothetical protein